MNLFISQNTIYVEHDVESFNSGTVNRFSRGALASVILCTVNQQASDKTRDSSRLFDTSYFSYFSSPPRGIANLAILSTSSHFPGVASHFIERKKEYVEIR